MSPRRRNEPLTDAPPAAAAVTPPPRRVCLGVVVGAHGVRGAVRIRSYTASPADIGAYGPLSDETGGREFAVTVVGQSRGQVIARLAGVEDRTAAEALKGLRLHVERSRLPEPPADEFYHADLIGLAAETVDGAPLGRVKAVFDFGAGDLLEVELASGGSVLVPFTGAVVPEVDLDGGRVVIDPPAGLIEEAEPPRGRSKARRGGRRRQ